MKKLCVVASPLTDPTIKGLKIFRDRFGKKGEKLEANGTSCGPFRFGFYIFDFSKDAKGTGGHRIPLLAVVFIRFWIPGTGAHPLDQVGCDLIALDRQGMIGVGDVCVRDPL